METLAILTIVTGVLSLVCLLILHFTSAEFHPGWRMISEYALGNYKWLLTSFFLLWATSSVLCAFLLLNLVESTWAIIGVMLVFVSGIGAAMGGLFDLKHKLHGLAFGVGVPTLPIGALLISYPLVSNEAWNNYRFPVLISAHSMWISVVLMAVSMMILFSGFKKAGIAMGPDVEPPKSLPPGVIAISGYMNRLLVICYIAWCIIVAKVYLSL